MAFIECFNGSLRDELLNKEGFDTLDDARRKLALWRYDCYYVRPHSSRANQTPAEARRALQQFVPAAHDAFAQTDDKNMKSKPTNSRYERGSLRGQVNNQALAAPIAHLFVLKMHNFEKTVRPQ